MSKSLSVSPQIRGIRWAAALLLAFGVPVVFGLSAVFCFELFPGCSAVVLSCGYLLLGRIASNRATRAAVGLLCAWSVLSAVLALCGFRLPQSVTAAGAIVSAYAYSVILRNNSIKAFGRVSCCFLGVAELFAAVGYLNWVDPHLHGDGLVAGWMIFWSLWGLLNIIATFGFVRCGAFDGRRDDAPACCGAYDPRNWYAVGMLLAAGLFSLVVWAFHRYGS